MTVRMALRASSRSGCASAAGERDRGHRRPVFAGLALVAADAAPRGTLPAAMRRLRPARADGLGAAADARAAPSRPPRLLIGAAIARAMLGPLTGAVALFLAGAAVALAAILARRQIGGYTGEALGFFQQIGEFVTLRAAAANE